MPDTPKQALLPGRRSLLVRLTCKEGVRPALLEILNTYTDGIEEEPGTELLVVSLDPENVSTIWLYEMFKDEGSENQHRNSRGFTAMMDKMPPLLDGPPAILRMDPLRMSIQEGVFAEDWAF